MSLSKFRGQTLAEKFEEKDKAKASEKAEKVKATKPKGKSLKGRKIKSKKGK